jgi:hypothetical protein
MDDGLSHKQRNRPSHRRMVGFMGVVAGDL